MSYVLCCSVDGIAWSTQQFVALSVKELVFNKSYTVGFRKDYRTISRNKMSPRWGHIKNMYCGKSLKELCCSRELKYTDDAVSVTTIMKHPASTNQLKASQ